MKGLYRKSVSDAAIGAVVVLGAVTGVDEIVAGGALVVEGVAAVGEALFVYGGAVLESVGTAVTSELSLLGELNMAHLAEVGLSTEGLNAVKIGGAANDAITQLISNDSIGEFNVTSTLFELNRFRIPFASQAFQGYGAELFSFEGLTYTGIGSKNFAENGVSQFLTKGSINTIGNFAGDYPVGLLPTNLGPSFGFMGAYILNTPGNIGANEINKRLFPGQK